jgi:hypothetical protein
MKMKAKIVVVLTIGLPLVSCEKYLDRKAERAMGAEPLENSYPVCIEDAKCPKLTVGEVKTDPGATQWIGEAASDSVQKCRVFLARLGYGQNALNLGFDVVSIGLAGAAAITVPVHSAQTLAALAGISTGARAAIDSDIFQQNAAPVITQKINATYMPGVRTLLGQTVEATHVNLPTMYGKLLATHSDCTLNAALSALANNTAAKPSTLLLTTDALKVNAVLVDPTTQQWYKVTTGYTTASPNITIIKQTVATPFLATPQSIAADSLLTQLNADGGFVLTVLPPGA